MSASAILAMPTAVAASLGETGIVAPADDGTFAGLVAAETASADAAPTTDTGTRTVPAEPAPTPTAPNPAHALIATATAFALQPRPGVSAADASNLDVSTLDVGFAIADGPEVSSGRDEGDQDAPAAGLLIEADPLIVADPVVVASDTLAAVPIMVSGSPPTDAQAPTPAAPVDSPMQHPVSATTTAPGQHPVPTPAEAQSTSAQTPAEPAPTDTGPADIGPADTAFAEGASPATSVETAGITSPAASPTATAAAAITKAFAALDASSAQTLATLAPLSVNPAVAKGETTPQMAVEPAVASPLAAAVEPSVLKGPEPSPKSEDASAPSAPDGSAPVRPATVAEKAPLTDTAQSAVKSSEPGPQSLPLPADSASAPTTTPAATLSQPSSAPASSAVTAQASTLSHLSQATIETTAQIAAQISRTLSGRSTRFEMGLTPEGLGRVDVSLEIDASGQLAARLAFDNPLAATELRGRVDDLRRELQDAGFTIARDGLEFAERQPSSGQGFDRRQGRAFASASRIAADADLATPAPAAWMSLSLTPRGVDLKV